MKLGIGDRVVPRPDVPCDGPPPPVGVPGVVIGWAVRFPGHPNTWIFDRDELEPNAIDVLAELVRKTDPCAGVGGSINKIVGIE